MSDQIRFPDRWGWGRGYGINSGHAVLRVLHDEGFSIWPFDPPSPFQVVEIYPRLLTGPVVKSSAEARRTYLVHKHWDISPEDRRLAEQSEDAFDAAVSAPVMGNHVAELQSLQAASDP